MFPQNSQINRRTALKLATSLIAASTPAAIFADNAKHVMRRKVPVSGEQLPVIGLGTSRVFDVSSDPESLAPRREIIRHMLDHGASIIDSSPMYGRAEKVVGEVCEQFARSDLFFATKVWTRGRDAGIEQMQNSLRLFNSDYIDLMQVHNLQDTDVHMRTIREWQDRKKIRYSGITHYRVGAHDDLESAIKMYKPDFVQLNYSLLTRDAENSLLPMAADNGVAVMVNRAFETGGVFRAVGNRAVPEWAKDFDAVSWGQFFLKYVLAHPAVTVVIPGTSKPRNMLDNLQAGTGRLPDARQRARMISYMKNI